MYIEHPLHPAGFQQLNLLSAVEHIVPPTNTVRVTIQVEAQNIRVRDDDADPTATVGIRITKDTTFILDSDTRLLRIIGEVSGAKVNLLWHRES